MPSVNLIPDELLLLQSRRRRIRQWRLCTLIAWLIATVPVTRELNAQFRLNAQKQEVHEVDAMLKTATQQCHRSEKRLELLRAEIARAQQLRYKRSWSGLWSAISEALPPGVWLTHARTDPPRPVVASGSMSPVVYQSNQQAARTSHDTLVGKVGSRRLVLEGQATGLEDIYVLVGALNRLSIFSSASLTSVREDRVEGVPVTHYVVECQW